MAYQLQYSQYSKVSILVEWPSKIDENILYDVLNFKNEIQNYYIKQKVELISTYNSILIIYTSTIEDVNSEFLALNTLYFNLAEVQGFDFKTWEIPVCYDEEFSEDLDAFSEQKKLSKVKIIRLHSEPIYTVYFIGFLPGFLYLGGLDKQLFFNRKTTPNLKVKKGSVAIGGQQTGIYPQDSPGGWHIIGNSPIDLFNVKQNPPCEIKAGDKVKFTPIDKHEYVKIQSAVSGSNYQLKPIERCLK